MSKLVFSIFLNAYSDSYPSNAPSRSSFRWNRDANGVLASNPDSLQFTLAPGETRSLVSGERSLTQDGTTQYSIAPVPFETSSYQFTWVGGTNPTFRTARVTGADTTTQVTVTLNGTVLTFTSTGGTNFSLISGGVIVGDYVTIGNEFNQANQGQYQIIGLTATSFSVVNEFGVTEGPITLGSSFVSQVSIYSAAGVQVGDTLDITGGFSLVTQGAYKITAVTDTYLQFSSTATLPTEGPITTEAISVYFMAKKLVYIESDQHVTLTINGDTGDEIVPLVGCGACEVSPGMFLRTSTIYSLSITNASTTVANLFLASIE
jgi:hypothetical protein